MRTILIFISVLVFGTAYSQTIEHNVTYGYDNAGNRTSRTIKLENKSAIVKDTTRVVAAIGETKQEEETEFQELFGKHEIKIYPNPTRGELKVTVSNLHHESATHLLVYSMSGTVVFRRDKISSSNRIDLSAQSPGIYIMRIVFGEETSEWKIIKE